MNALIGLCHFCENHGPRVIFCTQAFHGEQLNLDALGQLTRHTEPIHESGQTTADTRQRSSSAKDASYSSSNSSGSSDLPCKSSTKKHAGSISDSLELSLEVESSHSSDDGDKNAGKLLSKCSALSAVLKSSNCRDVDRTKLSLSEKLEELCEACRSLPSDVPGLVTKDGVSGVSYVSRQRPQHPAIFSMLHHACMRSISCEKTEGREGSVYFGAAGGTHVLSRTFLLSDSQARGLRRLYSLIVLTTDKLLLVSSCPFLDKQLQTLISQIKAKVNSKISADSQLPCSVVMRGGAVSRSLSGVGGKSLCRLTGDERIFEKLHAGFAWLLRAGASRLRERLLVGAPTEALCLDLDREEDTDEGFVKLYHRVPTDTNPPSLADKQLPERSSCLDAAAADKPLPGLSDSPDEVLQTKYKHCFNSLRTLLKVLGRSSFHTVAQHVMSGNSVLIRAPSLALLRSVIDCLKTLLPKSCCTVALLLEVDSPWPSDASLIGMALHLPFPDPPPSSLHLVLEISDPRLDYHPPASSLQHALLGLRHGCLTASDGVGTRSLDDGLAVSDCADAGHCCEECSRALMSLLAERVDVERLAELRSRHYLLYSPNNSRLPLQGPTLLAKIEAALSTETLSDAVATRSVICLKQEWISKVKLVQKATRPGGNRSREDKQKLLAVVQAVLPADKQLVEFWAKGLSDCWETVT